MLANVSQKIGGLARWMPRAVTDFFSPILPDAAIEITADYVTAVRLPRRHRLALASHAFSPLPEGCVTPSSVKPNVMARDELIRQLQSAVARAHLSKKEIHLLVPDLAARVMVLSFESIPDKAADLLALIKFKIKKSLPFNLDESQIAYQVQTLSPGHHEVVVTVIQRSILREYEEVVEALGLDPGSVTLSHFGLARALDGRSSTVAGRNLLLLRASPGMLTTSVYHHGALRFFRVVEKEGHVPNPVPSRAEEIFEELYPSLVYFQDKFEEKIEAIFLSGFSASANLLETVSAQAETPVRTLAVDPSLAAPLEAGASPSAARFDVYYAPAVSACLRTP